MKPIVFVLSAIVATVFRSRLSMQPEIVALRHQHTHSVRRAHPRFLAIAARVQAARGPDLRPAGQRDGMAAVAVSGSVVKLSQRGKTGRPSVPGKIKALIRKICSNSSLRLAAHPRQIAQAWHEVAKSTVEKYRLRHCKPPSPARRAFLKNHLTDLVSVDLFTMPTVGFKVLFVVVLAHDRRRLSISA